MKVTTSCCGRFHIFDQAVQLNKHGVLHKLINSYPKFITKKWGIPDEKTVALLLNGIYARLAVKLPTRIPNSLRSYITESVHHQFSNRLSHHVPSESDIFIGLSSFCLEALQRGKENGIITIVDHGSLHQKMERQLLEEEADIVGLKMEEFFAPDWIIEKEDREFNAADYVIVLSNAAKKSLVDAGINSEKIFINQCGVDLKNFYPLVKQDKIFRIIYCGGVIPRKGVHYLVKAFSELKLPNAELCIIGNRTYSFFVDFLHQYDLSNVRFIDPVPQNELVKIYSQGSMFILPSVADGFGMVVPQAMACGLPAVVSENVGASDIITDGVDGFVIPIRDVEALKDKILRLYEQPRLAEDMRNAALSKAKTELSWDAYGNRLIRFLERCVSIKGGVN
jgi:glycosyltransferase involved in cell wall biosynthesis